MDDIDFQFVYEIYPICKAGIAQLLQERSKGIKAGAYTMRQTWWKHIHQIECQHELSKMGLTVGL